MNKYFFFDRGVLQPQGMSNASMEAVEARKDTCHGAFFSEDYFSEPSRKWEVRYDNGYPNVVYDKDQKIYHLYYTMIIRDTVSESTDRAARAACTYKPQPDRVVALGYAVSRDGVHWEKPSLGMVEFDGSTDNNIMMMYAHGTSVFLDEQELDPKRRYKLMTRVDYPGMRGGMAVSFSPDGLHWEPLIPWPEHNPCADSHNFAFRDPRDRRFKLITRIWKNGLRICALCESDDFIHWSKPREILRGEGFKRQVYSMPVFPYENLYLGLASIFHEGDRSAEDFDLVDCELTYANQVDVFDFAAPGQACLARGKGRYPDGEFDCGCIYAASPVEIDGKLCVYYMGGNGPHTNFRETSFARAFFEKDKFVSLRGRPDEEMIVSTAVMHFYGNMFELLAEFGENASLEVSLRNKWNGEAYPGFDFNDSTTALGRDGYTAVDFRGDWAELEGKPVCIVIRALNTKLFAMRGTLIVDPLRY